MKLTVLSAKLHSTKIFPELSWLHALSLQDTFNPSLQNIFIIDKMEIFITSLLLISFSSLKMSGNPQHKI